MTFVEFCDEARASTGWTPDVPRLETQDYWYVFTYGKRRGKSSSFFTHEYSDARFVSIGWTKSSIYSIMNVEGAMSSYQLAIPHGTDQILGEVWAVPTDMMYELDAEERHLIVTKRLKIPVEISKGQLLDTWMYIADNRFLLKGGIKVTKYTGVTFVGSKRFLEIH